MCGLCGKRPRGKSGHCRMCEHDLDKMRQERRERNRPWWEKAYRVVTWKGHVLAYIPKGKDEFKARYIGCKSVAKVPKAKVLNLDEYVEGFDRRQIKNLKADFKAMVPYLRN